MVEMANSVEAEVVNIVDLIQRFREGKTKNLYLLMSQLRDSSLPNNVLLDYVKQLREHIADLDKDFEILVGFILMLDWTSRSIDLVEEYMLLVKNLVSAHTYYLTACLKMIVSNFRPRPMRADAIVTDEIRQRDAANFAQLHSLLCSITKIVPMTPIVLLPLLGSYFPFYMARDYVLECYVGNLLEMISYLPKYRGHILKLVISEMTKIDVHMPNVDLSDVETATAVKDEKCGKAVAPKVVSGDATDLTLHDKLDILMELVLNYVNITCNKQDGTVDIASTRSLLRDILDVFEIVVLATHASRYVQFIVFYICSLDEVLSGEFLERLWKKFEDPNVQSVLRQSAVLYIASYLVRAQHITATTVKLYLDTLVAWVRRYIKHSPQSVRPDVKRHGPFYSACLAIFYMFVYRHEDLLHKYGLKYCESLYLGTIATSWLNPLRVCLPHIATKFASVVRNNRVAFCDTVIERNRRCRLPETASSFDHGKSQTHSNQLDTCFPFEPYHLSRSRRFIADKYRNVSDFIDEQTVKPDADIKEEELYMEYDDDAEKLGAKNSVELYGTSPDAILTLPSS